MSKAGRFFVRINAGDVAPHPLAYRTKRPVVKGIHLRILESPAFHETVPALPNRGRTVCNHESPRRKSAQIKQPVGFIGASATR